MNPELPRHEEFPTFLDYKKNKKAEYSPERLSHYLNNELGTASNLVMTLRSRIKSSSLPPELASTMMTQIDEITGHLATVHEIGNISIDLLLKKDSEA